MRTFQILLILSVLLSSLQAESPILVQLVVNANFERDLQNWFTHESRDTQRDFIPPKITYENKINLLHSAEKSQKVVLFDYLNLYYDRRQGLVQGIFHTRENNLKNMKSPLLLSFAYKIRNLEKGNSNE